MDICYKPKTEEEFNQRWEELEKLGYPRWEKWSFNSNPYIIILTDSKPWNFNGKMYKVDGGVHPQNRKIMETWDQVLERIGYKELVPPKDWYVEVTPQIGRMLMKLDPESNKYINIENDINAMGGHGHKFCGSDCKRNPFYIGHGWTKISLEDTIKILLLGLENEVVRKTIEVIFKDGKIIVEGKTYIPCSTNG